MKTPSKLDQARAMREARYSVEPVRLAVSTETIDQQMIREGMIAKPKPKKAAATASDTVSWLAPAALPPEFMAKIAAVAAATVPWLAPKDQCASCDKRRAALKATMRKRRAAKP